MMRCGGALLPLPNELVAKLLQLVCDSAWMQINVIVAQHPMRWVRCLSYCLSKTEVLGLSGVHGILWLHTLFSLCTFLSLRNIKESCCLENF